MGSDAFSTPSPIQLLDTYRNLPQTKAVNFEMQVRYNMVVHLRCSHQRNADQLVSQFSISKKDSPVY